MSNLFLVAILLVGMLVKADDYHVRYQCRMLLRSLPKVATIVPATILKQSANPSHTYFADELLNR